MNASMPGGVRAIAPTGSPIDAQGESMDDTRALDRVALSSSEELREALVTDLVRDLAKAVDAQRNVAQLIRSTDENLTARLDELRQAAEQFVAVAVRHEGAFKGELAVKAAQLARREATEALSAELIKLQQLIVQQNRPRTSWRTIGMTVALTAAITIMLVGSAITSFRHVIGGP